MDAIEIALKIATKLVYTSASVNGHICDHIEPTGSALLSFWHKSEEKCTYQGPWSYFESKGGGGRGGGGGAGVTSDSRWGS